MTSSMFHLYLCVAGLLLTSLVQADMLYERRRPPSKTIHVHHFDGGSSGHNQKHGHGHGSDGSSLIELLLLSSLFGGGGGGLFGGQNQAIGIPIQAPVVNPGFLGR